MGCRSRWGLFAIALLHVTWWRCLRVQPLEWLCGGSGALHAASSELRGRCRREALRRRGAGGPPPVILDPVPPEPSTSAGDGQNGGPAPGEAVPRTWWDLREEFDNHKNAKHWQTAPEPKKSVHSPSVRSRWIRRVLGCRTVKNVRQCMESSLAEWPPAAVALAWQRVAKLGGNTPEVHRVEGRLAEELRQRNLYQFAALDLALIVYGWGVSRYGENGRLLKSLLKNVIERLDEQSPLSLVNMVYALGCLGNKAQIVEDLLGGICTLMAPSMLPNLKPLEISNTLWGMSKLFYLAPGFLRDVCEDVAPRLHTFKAQEISSIVSSMQRLGYRHPELMRAVCEEAPHRLYEFTPHQLNNLIYALGALHVKHSGFTMAVTEHVALRVLELQRAGKLEKIEKGLEVLQSL